MGIIARWRTSKLVRVPDVELQFEEIPEPAITGLGLFRDGVLPERNPGIETSLEAARFA